MKHSVWIAVSVTLISSLAEAAPTTKTASKELPSNAQTSVLTLEMQTQIRKLGFAQAPTFEDGVVCGVYKGAR